LENTGTERGWRKDREENRFCLLIRLDYFLFWIAHDNKKMALRKFWPEKCVDKEWEAEWQGPIFGIHAGFDPEQQQESAGGGSKRRVLRVGDDVVVLSRTATPEATPNRRWWQLCPVKLWLGLGVLVLVVLLALFL
jgi:hypothetical protein